MSQKMKEKSKGMRIKTSLNLRKENNKLNKGITLIALVITILFSYDEKIKRSNSKGFLLQAI